MKRVLVDVDTQVDFVAPTGALHVPASEAIVHNIETVLRAAPQTYDAVIGSVDSHAYDAWEFTDNGGPFAPHCIKGTPGWLRVWHHLPGRLRFVPMQGTLAHRRPQVDLHVGEDVEGGGNRRLDETRLAHEARAGVGLYFEKEVYSMFSNPLAEPVIEALVASLGGKHEVVFDVIGYCTGGYCVDGAALGLVQRGYRVRIASDATAPLGGEEGIGKTQQLCRDHDIEWTVLGKLGSLGR